MTTTVHASVSSADSTASAVRLRLKQPSDHPGMVDGAWWPRTRDLAVELAPLIAALDPVWGRIYRVTVQVGMWPEIPRKVTTGDHVVRVGWFDAEQDPHDICLISLRGRGRRDLLVVPPELDAERAERLMAEAATSGNLQTASALLASSNENADAAGRRSQAERIAAREPEGGPSQRSV